jgi:hypothetical protein
MAAIGCHVVYTNFLPVNRAGQVVDKNDPATTIKDTMETEHQHVVLPDALVPNSVGYPTIKRYLELEAAAGYEARFVGENLIVTYAR